jgi:hypothetical protein
LDRTERAFVLTRRDATVSSLDVTLNATDDSPLVNPALVIRNWNLTRAKVRVNGRLVAAGSGLRTGVTHRLDGQDLVAWMRHSGTAPLRIAVSRD